MIDKGQPQPVFPNGWPFAPAYTGTRLRGIEGRFTERVKNTRVQSKINQLWNLGYEFEVEPGEGAFSNVTYFAPALADGSPNPGIDTPLAVTWGLSSEMIEQDTWLLPVMVAETQKFPSDQVGQEALKRVKTLVNGIIEGETQFDSTLLDEVILTAPPDGGETQYVGVPEFLQLLQTTYSSLGLNLDVWLGFIRSRLRGTISKPIPTYGLTREILWGFGAINKVSLANVGKVLTTAQIVGIEGVPPGLIFDLPPGFWLKNAPQVQQQSDGRWAQVNTFTWAETFDNFIYELAT
jgi:hypothetical protein